MNEIQKDAVRLYSPRLITVATFLGMPVAGCLLLAHNYRSLGKAATARQILIWGMLGTTLLVVGSFFLPDTFPNMVLPIGYTVGMYQAVKHLHGKDYQTHLANGGAKGSVWKAIFTGLGCLFAIMVITFLAVFLYELFPQSVHKQTHIDSSPVVFIKTTFKHPVLGLLTYDDENELWTGKVEVRPGAPISFSISCSTGTSPKVKPEELFRRGVDFLNWARRAEPTVQERIADDLLDKYNKNWASENGIGMGQMSRKQFLKRIAPSSIIFYADGSTYWYYSDGGLFGGHTIEVRIDKGRTITEVCLAG